VLYWLLKVAVPNTNGGRTSGRGLRVEKFEVGIVVMSDDLMQ
jgi:hypothetical protein